MARHSTTKDICLYPRRRCSIRNCPGSCYHPDGLAQTRELFVAVYDGLVGVAECHVLAVVDQVCGQPAAGIRAHSVAGMAHSEAGKPQPDFVRDPKLSALPLSLIMPPARSGQRPKRRKSVMISRPSLLAA